jgi:tRNA(Arg) A34 adenosine deaminase TadA
MMNEELLTTVEKRHLRWLNHLADIAEESHGPEGGFRLAAGIVYKGSMVAVGLNNSEKSHPFHARAADFRSHKIYPHAETSCILKAIKTLSTREMSKATLYVARIKHPHAYTPAFVWGMARPCDACQSAIRQYGNPKVVYTTDEFWFDVL